jgi:hypothetical protein
VSRRFVLLENVADIAKRAVSGARGTFVCILDEFESQGKS